MFNSQIVILLFKLIYIPIQKHKYDQFFKDDQRRIWKRIKYLYFIIFNWFNIK